MFNGRLITINDVLIALQMNLPNLDHNRCYRLAELVGKKAWKKTHKSHRIQLGIEFRKAAAAGGLPVQWAGTTTCNKQLYTLR